MKYNYHTHTYRCGHATGSVEDYVQRSIQCGIKTIGFSDHMPYVCTNGRESPFRVPVAQAKDYVADISLLKEKYKNIINIQIGFEMEYYPDNFKDMLDNAIAYGAEYLILGQHYNREEHPGGTHNITPTKNVEHLREYVKCIVEAIQQGVFTYIAHPDLINFTGDEEIYQYEMRKICVASREYDVPLEINFLGIRNDRNYPNDIFWKMAGTEKSPVTFGFDAHDVESAYDGISLKKAKELIARYCINYIGEPIVILLNK